MLRRIGACLVVGLLASFLSGCEIVDSKLLSGSREYFPKAEVLKFYRPDIVQIETHVGNVSKKFADKTFRAMLQGREGRDLMNGLQLAGYRWFVLGFDEFNVVWDTQAGYYTVLDADEYVAWAQRTWGYVPIPQRVVR